MDERPLRTDEMENNEYVHIYIWCSEFNTDLGSNLKSDDFKEECRLLDINKARTSVQHYSQTEYFKGQIAKMLKTEFDVILCISDTKNDWDELLGT